MWRRASGFRRGFTSHADREDSIFENLPEASTLSLSLSLFSDVAGALLGFGLTREETVRLLGFGWLGLGREACGTFDGDGPMGRPIFI